MKWKDPIVEEVRQAGAEIARKSGNDLHRLCQHLRAAQSGRKLRPARRARAVAKR
jgi:hypothetical protein